MREDRPDFEACLARCQALTDQGELTGTIAFVHALLADPQWTEAQRLHFEHHEVWAALSIQRDQAFVQRVLSLPSRAQSLDDRLLLFHSLLLQARMQGRLRLTSAALQSIGRAQALLSPQDSAFDVWRLHNVLGFVLFEAGRFDTLLDHMAPLLPSVSVLDDPDLAPQLYSPATLLAAAHGQLDHLDEAILWRTALLGLSRERGWARREVSSAMNLANMHLLAGDVAQGRHHLEAAERVAAQVRCSNEANALLVLNRGLLVWKSGDAAAALAIMRQARDMAERDQEWIALERVLVRMQACALDAGEPLTALDVRTRQAELVERMLRETERLSDFCLATFAQDAQRQAETAYQQATGQALLTQELMADRAALETSVQQRTAALHRASQALAQQHKQAELSGLMVSVATSLEHPLAEAREAIGQLQEAAARHRQHFESARLRRSDVHQFHQDARQAVHAALQRLQQTAGVVRMFRSLSSLDAQEALVPSRVDMLVRSLWPVLQAKAAGQGGELRGHEMPPLQLTLDPSAFALVLGELVDRMAAMPIIAEGAAPLDGLDAGSTATPGRIIHMTLAMEDHQAVLRLTADSPAGLPSSSPSPDVAWLLLARLCEQALGGQLSDCGLPGCGPSGYQLSWPLHGT